MDGSIDGELARDIVTKRIIKAAWEEELPTIALPFVHKSSYNNFRRYFYILESLGLIERVGRREWDVRHTFFRQKYRIVKGKEDSKAWEAPQLYLYPLAWIGKRRYETLLDDTARRLNLDLEEFLKLPYEKRKVEIMRTIEKSSEWQKKLKLKEVADYWGITVTGLLRKMRRETYQSTELLRERAERAEKIGVEKSEVLRGKIERRRRRRE